MSAELLFLIPRSNELSKLPRRKANAELRQIVKLVNREGGR